eukprot:5279655-Prymnesium_polylepis.1
MTGGLRAPYTLCSGQNKVDNDRKVDSSTTNRSVEVQMTRETTRESHTRNTRKARETTAMADARILCCVESDFCETSARNTNMKQPLPARTEIARNSSEA